jgi:hypothetical protein
VGLICNDLAMTDNSDNMYARIRRERSLPRFRAQRGPEPEPEPKPPTPDFGAGPRPTSPRPDSNAMVNAWIRQQHHRSKLESQTVIAPKVEP